MIHDVIWFVYKKVRCSTNMPLPKHERTKEGAFRKENGNSRAKNLAKDYPEFSKGEVNHGNNIKLQNDFPFCSWDHNM